MGEQGRHVLEGSGSYWRTLTLARLGNLIFLPVLLLYVYRWSSELYGRLAGLIAAVLASASPNILAHAGLAAIDISITATLVPAAYYTWRWLDHPSWRFSLQAGLWGGIAIISKYSAIGFLPAIVSGLLLICCWREYRQGALRPQWKQRRALLHGAVYGLSLCFVVAICFQLASRHMDETPARLLAVVDENIPPGSPMHWPVATAVRLGQLVAPGLPMGLVVVVRHAIEGHSWQFFMGELKEYGGWRLYFPVVLAVKTTLPFLMLLAIAIGLWFLRRGDPTHRQTVYVAMAAAGVLAVAMASTLNIGVRHILPMYPFLAILASSVFAVRAGVFSFGRPVILVSSLLVVSHIAESAAAHPEYLSYFNAPARGHEHELLGDSNLDWGLDLGRLAVYLKENDIREIHLAYYGVTSPEAVGIEGAHPFGPNDRPRGKIAISINLLQGLGPAWSRGDYTWLRAYEPYAKVGKSIWLYDIQEDAR
jgi:4-amino-4-deoxy-L-arabinose transferase-like glycosyltransferase